MASYNLILFFSFFFFFLQFSSLSSPQPTQFNTPTSKHQGNNLIRTSCIHSRYPTICLQTLSAYRGPTSTPYDVARAALKVSLNHALSLSAIISSRSRSHIPTSKKESVAIRDCAEMIANTVDELTGALRELKRLGTGEEGFGWAMSNAETWVSAALTDEDTCLEGFDDVGNGEKGEIGKKVSNVAKVTSNALYMINKLDKSRGRV